MQRHINPPVFYGSTAIIAALVILCAVAPHRAEIGFDALQAWVLGQFGWFYILSVSIYLGVALILGLGRFGRLKLGPDDAVPDYPFASWLAMLFAAGMGIGLMFFAVGEPMTHFAAPPEAVARTIAAEREAMQVTFFHWGLHAWGIYAVVGLSLAYFGYRYNLPLTIRSGLYPLLKERINGPIGNAVDIFAICGTLFGLATSLGLGVLQINSGLNYLTGIPVSVGVQVGLIALITAVASVSVVTGLDKGVRRLSELNLLLALVLMIFVLAVGPTTLLLKSFVQNIGLYLDDILLRSFNIYAYEPRTWIDSWTLFYWAWWISWSPFVGMFIARISRGRTVREFVLAVLFIPAGFTFLWMTVFGNSAFFVDTTMANGALATAVAEDVSVGLFQFFQYLPMPAVTSTLAVMLVAVFFVTSSDSGSLVVDTIAAGGAPTTPVAQRLFWCSLEGIVAAVLLIAGGLSALQTATIASALPFAIIILVLCWGLFKGMSADLAGTRAGVGVPAAHPAAGVPWQKRLGLILHAPDEADVRRFIDATAVPALEAVAGELTSSGREATVSRDADGVGVSLVVTSVDVRNFVYGVQHATEKLPVFSTIDPSQEERRHEARTAFSDGSRGYDVMGFDKDHLIGDVLVQFERYLALVHSPHSQLFVRSPEAMAE